MNVDGHEDDKAKQFREAIKIFHKEFGKKFVDTLQDCFQDYFRDAEAQYNLDSTLVVACRIAISHLMLHKEGSKLEDGVWTSKILFAYRAFQLHLIEPGFLLYAMKRHCARCAATDPINTKVAMWELDPAKHFANLADRAPPKRKSRPPWPRKNVCKKE